MPVVPAFHPVLSLGVHCVRVAVQHGFGTRETWLSRPGSRLESQYGGPMGCVVCEG